MAVVGINQARVESTDEQALAGVVGEVRLGGLHIINGTIAGEVVRFEQDAAAGTGGDKGAEGGLIVRSIAHGGTDEVLHARHCHEVIGVLRLRIGGESDALAITVHGDRGHCQSTTRTSHGVAERVNSG